MKARIARDVIPMDWQEIRSSRRRRRSLHNALIWATWVVFIILVLMLAWNLAIESITR